MHRYLQFIVSIIFLAGFTACKTSNIGQSASACRWMQHSAEYDALATSVYYSAISHLPQAVEDSFWTAAPHHQKMDFYKLPPAVILDVDATVLDNSAYFARKIEENSNVDTGDWHHWVKQTEARPVPGGPEFTRIASRLGVTVFYVTNRDVSVEEATRKNLAELGFPLDRNKDVILSKNEKEGWTADKSARRDYIAHDYRIVMIVGDDLGDFISTEGMGLKEQKKMIREKATDWGRKWFMLPNPVYGPWNQDRDQLEEKRREEGRPVAPVAGPEIIAE